MTEPIRTESPRTASHAEDLASYDPDLELEGAASRVPRTDQQFQLLRDA